MAMTVSTDWDHIDITQGSNTNRHMLKDAEARESLETKAEQDGSYTDMTVGNAEQLVSAVGITDKVPYNFRTAGGSADIGDRAEDMVVGGSIVWNQLALELNGTYWGASSASASYSNGVATVHKDSSTGETARLFLVSDYRKPVRSGHKYLFVVTVQTTNGQLNLIPNGSTSYGQVGYTSYQNKTTINYIWNCGVNDVLFYDLRGYTGYDVTSAIDFTVENPMCFDLTQMFGSAIADYLYTLETATPGAGVAWFKKLFPKPYYEYDAGTLMHVQTSAHNMTGLNQWDSDKIFGDNGFVEQADGSWYIANNSEVSVDNMLWENKSGYQGRMYLSCNRKTLNSTGSGGGRLKWLYTDGTSVILYWENSTSFVNQTSKSGEGKVVKGIGWDYGTASNPTWFKDVCVSFSWDGERDGEYEPYTLNSYLLDNTLELRGIPKLDSANELYYDGDIYEADGTVTRKYGVVDLGGLTWIASNHQTFGQYFYANLYPIAVKYQGDYTTTVYNGACSKYVISRRATNAFTDKTLIFDGSTGTVTQIQIKDSAYSDATAFKDAMSGVYLVYELATPTIESADPFQTPQIVDNWGTEQYVDAGTRDVEIPVGHETWYPQDLRSKLEMVPNSPDGDGDYIVRQTNGENEYVPLVIPTELPTNPTTDGTYVLKVTVSDGTPTLTWVSE